MRKLRSQARKVNLLFVLELLDETVRESAIAPQYVGTTTELAVQEAIRRARRPPRRHGIQPRQDQMVMEPVLA